MKFLIAALLLFTNSWARATWSDLPINEIRVFYYNVEGDMARPIVKDGHLDESVEAPKEGIALSKDQRNSLLRILDSPDSFGWIGACFNPRHAFLIYDDSRSVIGKVEICFDCNTIETDPIVISGFVDFLQLAKLIHGIGLPIGPDGETLGSFTEEHRRTQAEFHKVKVQQGAAANP